VAKNSDALLHNTNLILKVGDSGKTLANIALTGAGKSQTEKLKKAGLVEVKCDVHEWMKAWIYVSKHPYVAVSGDDGSFEIGDVPAGKYKALVWHEALGQHEAEVEVTAGGTAELSHAFN
jgi:hypothetical protein